MKFDAYAGSKTGAAPFTGASALLLSFAVLLGPLFTSRAIASAITEAQATQLKPGGYLWDPSVAPSGPITVVVKLDSQRVFVWRNGKLIGISMIASGKPGYETPDGVFTVLEKQKDHHSTKYDDAPMPYMQRLTGDGIALHGGHPRGYPASHGCIRLPMGFAAALFKEDKRGMHVVITGRTPEQSQTTVASRQKPRVPEQPNDWQAVEYSNGEPNGPSAATDQPGNGEAVDKTDGGTGNLDLNRYPSQDRDISYDNDQREQDQAQSRENPARQPPPKN